MMSYNYDYKYWEQTYAFWSMQWSLWIDYCSNAWNQYATLSKMLMLEAMRGQ